MTKYKSLFLIGLTVIFFTSCKRDTLVDDFENSNNIVKMIPQKGWGGKHLLKHPGGYVACINGQTKVGGISLFDQYGNLIRTNLESGTLKVEVRGIAVDEAGNSYVGGMSNSPEYRMDNYTSLIDTDDAYLAKYDPNGNLVWKRGYSDTAGPWEGYVTDWFEYVFYANNKIYGVGFTQNYMQSYSQSYYDMFVAVFDLDGNFIKQVVLPTLHIDPTTGSAVGFLSSSLNDGDILCVSVSPTKYSPIGRQDTTVVICRFDIDTDTVQWSKKYLKNSPAGDIMTVGENSIGELLTLDFTTRLMVKLNQFTGDIVSTKTLNFEGTTDAYEYAAREKMYLINNKMYCIGTEAENQSAQTGGVVDFADSYPWIMELEEDGTFIKSTKVPIKSAYFFDMLQNEDGNLLMYGSLNTHRSGDRAGFFVTLDLDGNLVSPQ